MLYCSQPDIILLLEISTFSSWSNVKCFQHFFVSFHFLMCFLIRMGGAVRNLTANKHVFASKEVMFVSLHFYDFAL